LVVVVGIDPTSWAYEARAHPSTPYNQIGVKAGIEPWLPVSQTGVLPLHY